MKKLTLLLLGALLCTGVKAQTNDLTKDVQEALMMQARIKVDELTNHISFIMSKKYDNNVKDHHIKAALNLFVGMGGPYTDVFGNLQPAPRMQVSSINRSTGHVRLKEYQVSDYLSNLKYLSYDSIEIKNSKSTYISQLHKVGTDEYQAVLSWVQVFIGKSNDMIVYKDTTKKNIIVRMSRKNYGGFERWDVLLGDTTAAVTE